MHGERKARMTIREKHEAEKRKGMHTIVARISSRDRRPVSRTL